MLRNLLPFPAEVIAVKPGDSVIFIFSIVAFVVVLRTIPTVELVIVPFFMVIPTIPDSTITPPVVITCEFKSRTTSLAAIIKEPLTLLARQ